MSEDSPVMRRLWLRGVGAALGFLLFGASLVAPKVERWWMRRTSACTKLLSPDALSQLGAGTLEVESAYQHKLSCDAWYGTALSVHLDTDPENAVRRVSDAKNHGATVETLVEGSAWLAVDGPEEHTLVLKRPQGCAAIELKKPDFTAEKARKLFPLLTNWTEADAFLAAGQ